VVQRAGGNREGDGEVEEEHVIRYTHNLILSLRGGRSPAKQS
jgi:hypothetical protein